MSDHTRHRSSNHMNGSMHSQANSMGSYEPFILRELFEQTGMLHEIKATVEHVGETVSQHGLDIAELKTRPHRAGASWAAIAKENWSWLAAALVILLQLLGQPQMAERLSSASRPPDFGDSSP